MIWRMNQNGSNLQHAGILGQKWGVRNGPPYPLSYGKHSSAEKSRNPKSKIDGNPETGKKKSSSGLTDGQKRAIKIGAIVAGTALVAIGGYEIYKHRAEIKQLVGKGKSRLIGSGKVDKIPDSGLFKPSDIISHANNRNSQLNASGSLNHCTNIFMQMECESRGISAEALSRLSAENKGRKIDDVVEAFKGASLNFDSLVKSPKASSINTPESFKEYLISKVKAEPNSRGFATVTLDRGNGSTFDHAIKWELNDGKLSLVDGPNGDKAIRYLSMLSSDSRVGLFRTDNLELDLDYIDKNFVDLTRKKHSQE